MDNIFKHIMDRHPNKKNNKVQETENFEYFKKLGYGDGKLENEFKSDVALWGTNYSNMSYDNCSYALKDRSMKYNIKTIADKQILIGIDGRLESNSTLVIPEGINSIANGCFEGINEIVHIVMPDTVENLGEAAFENCRRLETVRLSKCITAIPERVFKNCTNLKTINLSKIESIGSEAFAGDYRLELDSLKSLGELMFVGNKAFTDCVKLTNKFLETDTMYLDKLETVCKQGFYKANMINIRVPKLKSVGQGAFCTNKMTKLKLYNTFSNIPAYAFADGKIEDIRFCGNVEKISGKAFETKRTTNGKYYEIPNSLLFIDGQLFKENDRVKTNSNCAAAAAAAVGAEVIWTGKSEDYGNYINKVNLLGATSIIREELMVNMRNMALVKEADGRSVTDVYEEELRQEHPEYFETGDKVFRYNLPNNALAFLEKANDKYNLTEVEAKINGAELSNGIIDNLVSSTIVVNDDGTVTYNNKYATDEDINKEHLKFKTIIKFLSSITEQYYSPFNSMILGLSSTYSIKKVDFIYADEMSKIYRLTVIDNKYSDMVSKVIVATTYDTLRYICRDCNYTSIRVDTYKLHRSTKVINTLGTNDILSNVPTIHGVILGDFNERSNRNTVIHVSTDKQLIEKNTRLYGTNYSSSLNAKNYRGIDMNLPQLLRYTQIVIDKNPKEVEFIIPDCNKVILASRSGKYMEDFADTYLKETINYSIKEIITFDEYIEKIKAGKSLKDGISGVEYNKVTKISPDLYTEILNSIHNVYKSADKYLDSYNKLKPVCRSRVYAEIGKELKRSNREITPKLVWLMLRTPLVQERDLKWARENVSKNLINNDTPIYNIGDTGYRVISYINQGKTIKMSNPFIVGGDSGIYMHVLENPAGDIMQAAVSSYSLKDIIDKTVLKNISGFKGNEERLFSKYDTFDLNINPDHFAIVAKYIDVVDSRKNVYIANHLDTGVYYICSKVTKDNGAKMIVPILPIGDMRILENMARVNIKNKLSYYYLDSDIGILIGLSDVVSAYVNGNTSYKAKEKYAEYFDIRKKIIDNNNNPEDYSGSLLGYNSSIYWLGIDVNSSNNLVDSLDGYEEFDDSWDDEELEEQSIDEVEDDNWDDEEDVEDDNWETENTIVYDDTEEDDSWDDEEQEEQEVEEQEEQEEQEVEDDSWDDEDEDDSWDDEDEDDSWDDEEQEEQEVEELEELDLEHVVICGEEISLYRDLETIRKVILDNRRIANLDIDPRVIKLILAEDKNKLLDNAKNHLNKVNTHRKYVCDFCNQAGIIERGNVHDLTKYSEQELFESILFYEGTRSPIDKSREIFGKSPAFQHHIKYNDHHLEQDVHEENGVKYAEAKKFLPAVECVCDFCGAAKAYLGEEKFSMSGELDWWRNRLSKVLVIGETIHKDTASFITICLEACADKNRMLQYNEFVDIWNELHSGNEELQESYKGTKEVKKTHKEETKKQDFSIEDYDIDIQDLLKEIEKDNLARIAGSKNS